MMSLLYSGFYQHFPDRGNVLTTRCLSVDDDQNNTQEVSIVKVLSPGRVRADHSAALRFTL